MSSVISFIKTASSSLLSFNYLASQNIIDQLEEKEWCYVASIGNPIGSRITACIFTTLDKISNTVFLIAMAVEAAAKAVYVFYLHLRCETVHGDDGRELGKKLALRASLAALVSVVYVPSVLISLPLGILRSLMSPANEANRQLRTSEWILNF